MIFLVEVVGLVIEKIRMIKDERVIYIEVLQCSFNLSVFDAPCLRWHRFAALLGPSLWLFLYQVGSVIKKRLSGPFNKHLKPFRMSNQIVELILTCCRIRRLFAAQFATT